MEQTYQKNLSLASSNIHIFNVTNPDILIENEESSKLVNTGRQKNHAIKEIKEKEFYDQNGKEEKYRRKSIFKDLLSFINVSVFIFFSFSVYLYILSLAGCHDTQTACLVNLNPQFFHNIVIFLSISSILNSIFLFLIIKNSISRFHLFYMTGVFGYITLIYDTGSDLSHHGSYNRTVFLVLLLISIALIYLISLVINLIKKRYFKVIIFFTILALLVIVYVNIKITDCSRWTKGLNNKHLNNSSQNNNDKCPIIPPQKCWIDFLDGALDVSWYLQEDCQNFRTGERIELLKYLPERYRDTYLFGYPITNVFTYVPESFHIPFFYNLMKNFIDLENPKNNNFTNNYYSNEPEVILNFDRNSELGRIEFNIKKNLSLIKERRIKAENYKNRKNHNDKKIHNDDLVENVLFIYIDSISRQHFLRKMKGTINFMEKYFKNINEFSTKEKISSEKSFYSKFNFYQFLKYHAFIYFTQPNVNPMFYGESMRHNNGTHIMKHFHEKGFISAQSNNICSRELYDIEPGFIENLTWEPFDHENIALFCDPNYFNPENPFTPYMGPYSIKKRCLYGKNTFEYVLEYGEKFWETYIQEKKFLRLAFQDAHEGTGEVARYLDEYLSIFLEKFNSRGWLEKTAIFIVSDHGNNMIGFYNLFNCEDFIKEKTLATWFLLLPKENFEKYDEILKENENLMVTPYDIFDTLISLIHDEKTIKSNYGQSVIKEKVYGIDRTCHKYKLDMLDIWCRCDIMNE